MHSEPGGVRGGSAFTNSVFEVVAHGYRRRVLRRLSRADGPVSVTRLASEIAARDAGVPVGDVPPERRARVRTALVHVHLPKLAAAGLVTWDGHRVALTEYAGALPFSIPLERLVSASETR
ncbi:MAG: ArsR family transcriptional regulator [Haloarculaceae archaeon]